MNLLGTHAKNGPRPDYRQGLLDSLVKLNPLYLWKDSPVMLVVEAGFALVLAMGLAPGAFAGLVNQSRWFYFVIAGILLLTVWFSTFSEAVSEAQGRARVDALRTLEKDVPARKIVGDSEVIVPSRFLDPGDVVRASAGEFIPRDGVIKEGKAYIDESMMTGESIPSYKETGSHVIGGTKVATDSILITIVAEAGKSYLDQMISLVENAKRPKSASEVSLTILLVGLTAIFVVVCSAFLFLADHLGLVIDLAILISPLASSRGSRSISARRAASAASSCSSRGRGRSGFKSCRPPLPRRRRAESGGSSSTWRCREGPPSSSRARWTRSSTCPRRSTRPSSSGKPRRSPRPEGRPSPWPSTAWSSASSTCGTT